MAEPKINHVSFPMAMRAFFVVAATTAVTAAAANPRSIRPPFILQILQATLE